MLLAEAQTALEADGGDGCDGSEESTESGRLALIARRFVATELEDRPARGITSGDRDVLEAFEPIVRGAAVDPDALSEPAPADD